MNKTTGAAGGAVNKTTDTAGKGANSAVEGATGTSKPLASKMPFFNFGGDPNENARWLPDWLTERWKAADMSCHQATPT